MSPAEASTKGLAAELAALGQAQGGRVLCPVPHVAGGADQCLECWWSAAEPPVTLPRPPNTNILVLCCYTRARDDSTCNL